MIDWKILVEPQSPPKINSSNQKHSRRKVASNQDAQNINYQISLEKNLPTVLADPNSRNDAFNQKTVNNVCINEATNYAQQVCDDGYRPHHTVEEAENLAGICENVVRKTFNGEKTMTQVFRSPSNNNPYPATNVSSRMSGAPQESSSMFSQKALPPPPDVYSYASVEHRPVSVTGSGAITSPVNDRTRTPPSTNSNVYSYTPVDIRPLAVGIDGGVSIPITDQKQGAVPRTDVRHTSVNDDLYAVLEKDNGNTQMTTKPYSPPVNDDVYAVVDKKTKPPPIKKNNPKSSKTNYAHRQLSDSVYDSVADPVQQNTVNTDDVYAAVDMSKKRRGSEQPISHVSYPADFNPNVRRPSDDLLNTPYFQSPIRKPPPMPKPYDQRIQLAPHPEESTSRQHQLDPFNRNSISAEDMSSAYSEVTVSQQKKHVLTASRSTSDERLTHSHNAAQFSNGMKNFQKSHRRMRSHENVSILRSFDLSSGNNSPHTDSSSSCSMSNKSEDDVFMSRNNPETIADLLKKTEELTTNNLLPDGWQEVQDDTETYFWHIWTGTIQYERPSLTATPTSSSRSISPFSGHDSAASSRTPSVADILESPKGHISPKPETTERPKQIISFPVHSMGWMDVDESLMGASIIGDTVNSCISKLAKERKDLYNTAETWAEGADLRLILEGEILKLIDYKTAHLYHVQPIVKMRVWGVGRDGEEKRDFAYIARDTTTKKHRCHMFRCHGQVSGRSVTNALQAICTRVLNEKRKAKERSESPVVKQSSDLLRPPSKLSTTFNEKPYAEEKKLFTAKYVGGSEVSSPSGIDVVNRVVSRLSDGETSSDWSSVLVEVTTSEIKTIDCVKQQVIVDHRVRFISFLSVGQDERFGAYIVAVAENQFMCHVFFCAPHAGTLTRAIQEACKLRFEKTLDSQSIKKKTSAPTEPLKLQPPPPGAHAQQQQQSAGITSQRGSVKEKTKMLTSSLAGVFNKLNRKDVKKKEDILPTDSTLSPFNPAPNEHVIKYFGAMPVVIGTGRETVEHAAENLAHGDLMMGYLEVGTDCITLSDSQRLAVSQRIFDVSNISYCGMTSDRKNFGVVISRGKGKFICHIFQEYKANSGVEIVDAIQGVL